MKRAYSKSAYFPNVVTYTRVTWLLDKEWQFANTKNSPVYHFGVIGIKYIYMYLLMNSIINVRM